MNDHPTLRRSDLLRRLGRWLPCPIWLCCLCLFPHLAHSSARKYALKKALLGLLISEPGDLDNRIVRDDAIRITNLFQSGIRQIENLQHLADPLFGLANMAGKVPIGLYV